MKMPKNAEAVAAAFEGLPADRKKQLLEHLAATPDARASETIDQAIKNGGPEGAFVAAVFGRPIPKKS